MSTFEKAGSDVRDVLSIAMQRYHSELEEAGVTVDLLMASPPTNKDGDATGPAIKQHGIPCIATIRTVSYKDRVKGCSDLEIVIDQEWWAAADEAQQIAMLDHELLHRTLKYDKDGVVKTDDCGRPKFDIAQHDWDSGWFATTALRHGEKSVEIEQARRMVLSDRWQNCIDKFLPHPAAIEATSRAEPNPDADPDPDADPNEPASFVSLELGGDDAEESADEILSDDWKKWPVDCLSRFALGPLGLSDSKLKLLIDHGIKTMGKLVKVMEKPGNEDSWWQDIKGFGEAGFDSLSEALDELYIQKPAFQEDQ